MDIKLNRLQQEIEKMQEAFVKKHQSDIDKREELKADLEKTRLASVTEQNDIATKLEELRKPIKEKQAAKDKLIEKKLKRVKSTMTIKDNDDVYPNGEEVQIIPNQHYFNREIGEVVLTVRCKEAIVINQLNQVDTFGIPLKLLK